MRILETLSALLASLTALVGMAGPVWSFEPPGSIGVAKVDITPERPVRMYGYASRTTESEGAAGRLKAAALAIGGDEGAGPAVLLTVDCGAVPGEIRAEVLRRLQAKAPLKSDRFVLCNSHTHAGPNLKGMGSLSGEERRHLQEYALFLTDRLESVVSQALLSRRPGRLSWGRGQVSFAANRRMLEDGKWVGFGAVAGAPVDHSLPVLRVTDEEGRLLAVLINYACHNTTLRPDFKEIHGDWAGCAQELIEAEHPGVVAMVSIGCGADADPHPHGTVELCLQHGRAVAEEVKRVLAGSLRPVVPRVKARARDLEIVDASPSPPATPVAGSYPLVTWSFGGDLAMVFLSNEVVVDFALRLKRELDESRLWINAYANDVSSYIVSKRLISEGGYEVKSSLSSRITQGQPERIRPPVEDRIVEAVRALLPATFVSAGDRLETPAEIWARARKSLLPLEWTIEKDETVPSDTRPGLTFRRVEVKFYSQELEGRKWSHPCVVFVPVDPSGTHSRERLGKCVIVGQRGWDGLATGPWRESFLANYGEPIAAETGYATMICPHPGEYDEAPGRELSIGRLGKLWAESRDVADHPHFRLAIIYLRALDVMAGVLNVDKDSIRAVIGGHSKRATCAHTAATADPRIVGVVYMGNESCWVESHLTYPERNVFPPVADEFTAAEILYLGGLNEDGYTMFNINRIIGLTDLDWTVAMVPNYRHASQSEKHFMDWKMWVSHCFEGRPITKVTDLSYEKKGPDFEWGGRQYGAGGGTLFRCKIETPNKIIQAKVWYVYCNDEPYWRDLMWYPEFMVKQDDGSWAGYVTGRLPDVWIVEVKDIAFGRPGYITSLPQDITGKQTLRRDSRGSRSRNWTPVGLRY